MIPLKGNPTGKWQYSRRGRSNDEPRPGKPALRVRRLPDRGVDARNERRVPVGLSRHADHKGRCRDSGSALMTVRSPCERSRGTDTRSATTSGRSAGCKHDHSFAPVREVISLPVSHNGRTRVLKAQHSRGGCVQVAFSRVKCMLAHAMTQLVRICKPEIRDSIPPLLHRENKPLKSGLFRVIGLNGCYFL